MVANLFWKRFNRQKEDLPGRFVKGHPRNLMTMEDCEEKFRNCLSFSARPLSGEKASALLKAVKELDKINDVSEIVNCLK